MNHDDAVVAQALLVRHGWTAYRSYDETSAHVWCISACWPPMFATAHEMGAPDAAWYTIHSKREVVRAVCLYSAHRQEAS